ncbi:hypothetical protein M409DRAFT_56097 [Zasmidium cellare ATCC 36951]|uniref:Uncharacterized protein n=1 Tax=Zasmidium cellare ATCC 36951 TaxID=1080233 RepID=A0A6A6CEZ5_ZASCE|nr:uncharacterized protein M409DRAFT_56097 [Zasmidium cellare ATCC 36951]KAF2165223.1 hypothetical protein M409DRAFT_56097 [Zasmidium cellare ATCC 36951]
MSPTGITLAAATAFALFAVRAQAADIVFGSSGNCSDGIALYGASNLTAVDCFALPTDDDEKATSALISNITAGQLVQFFADANCKTMTEQFSDDACYTSVSPIGSFRILPEDDQPKDLVVLPTRLSNYTDLQVAPDAVILASHLRSGLHAVASAASGALTFAVIFTDCYDVANGETSGTTYFACIGGVLASALSFAASIEHAYHTVTSYIQYIGDTAEILHAAIGSAKRSVDGKDIFVPVGNVTRPLSGGRTSTTTLFQSEMGGVTWHTASFADDQTGEVYHHLVPASQSPLKKRATPGYDVEQWTDGGVLLTLCPVNTGAPLSGISSTAQDNYSNYYSQITCALKGISREATKVSVDILNTAGTVVAQAGIVPYGASGGPTSAESDGQCPNSSIAPNPGCWTN